MANGLLSAIINPNIPDLQGAYQKGREQKARGLAGRLLGERLGGQYADIAEINPDMAMQAFQASNVIGDARQAKFREDVQVANQLFQVNPIQGRAYVEQRIMENEQLGIPSPDMRNWLAEYDANPQAAIQGLNALDSAFTSSALATKGDPVQSSKILPNGGVIAVRKSGALTVTDPQGNILEGQDAQSFIKKAGAEKIANDLSKAKEEAAIRVETERQISGIKGAQAGKTSAINAAIKAGEAAFEKLAPVKSAIQNIDDAITAIDDGAETGFIMSKLPSIKAESIRLDNIKNRMGLDVVGSVTFGALSASELDMALDTALPTNLEGQELKKWLQAKKQAQLKTIANLEEAAAFLARGTNTIDDFIQLKKAERQIQDAPPSQSQTVRQPAQVGRFTVEVE